MEKEEVKQLAKDIMFDVNEQEVEEIQNDFVFLDEMIDMLDLIDTSNTQEMVYPFDTPVGYFREDEPDDVISQNEAMSNVTKSKQGHVVVPKVVK